MKWSISVETNLSVWGKELKHVFVRVGKWYGLEPLSSITGSRGFVRSDLALRLFSTELPWSQNPFYGNRLYVEGTAESDTERDASVDQKRKKKTNYGVGTCTL